MVDHLRADRLRHRYLQAFRIRSRRTLFGFENSPVRVTIAIALAWWVAIAAFVWVMIAYELPRTKEPAGIAILSSA